MKPGDEKLQRILKEIDTKESAPQFDIVWTRARARASSGGTGDAWRWALVPGLVAMSAVALVLVFSQPSENTASAEMIASLENLTQLDAGTMPFDYVFESDTDYSDDEEEADDEDGTGEELAYEDGIVGEGLFVGETDFLLEIEIPSWDQGEERNLL